MKFRGKMIDNACIRQFSQLVILIARLSKTNVIRITDSKIFFIITEVGGLSGGSNPGLWAELEQGHFFNEFNMEGVSADNNEIFLELTPVCLPVASLQENYCGRDPPSFHSLVTNCGRTVDLFHNNFLPSLSSRPRLVVHDIPVTLIPRRLWYIYQEPAMPSYEVSIYLPALRQLRHVVDRLKNLSNHVTLSANYKGTFILSVATDTVDVSMYFKNLPVPSWDDTEARSTNLDELHSATVDIKRLALFLQGDQVNPSKAICNIVGGRTVHLFLLHDDVTLQYFLPAVTTG